jgi:pyrimidine deaminase RibD-like protein
LKTNSFSYPFFFHSCHYFCAYNLLCSFGLSCFNLLSFAADNRTQYPRGGERGPDSAFPKPTTGAVLVAADGRILGQGRSDYMKDCVQAVIADAGLKATPLKEWIVDWVPDPKFREDLASSTLYLTLEPSPERKGERLPSITKLIEQAGIPNVVIGCPNPVPELAHKGAAALHSAGLSVKMLQPTDPLHQECLDLIPIYSGLVNSKVWTALMCLLPGSKAPLSLSNKKTHPLFIVTSRCTEAVYAV